MKSLLKLTGLFVFVAIVITGCVKGDFDEPPINIPTVNFSSNTTIAQLKASYSGLKEITEDIVIQGMVVANDESGNLYKKMVIQDKTGGIELALDRTSLYTEFKRGQRVFIKCKGMYIGDYNNLIQLGYIYNGAIGRLPDVNIKNHLFRDSLPGIVPAPRIVTPKTVNMSMVSTLVRFENVTFADAGLEWAPQTVDNSNRILTGPDGGTITVRTSKYSNFAGQLVPAGSGNIEGILTVFSSTWQLTLRNIEDVRDFGGINPPPPTGDFPYPDGSFTAVASIDEKWDNVITATDIVQTGWTNLALKGNRKWQGKTFNAEKYAQATSYNSTDESNVSWIVTPPVTYTSNLKLKFKSAMAYWKHDGLQVWILYGYDGTNSAASTWKQITTASMANSASGDNVWVESGSIELSTYVPAGYAGNVYIGYKYEGTKSNTTTYRIDEIAVNTNGGGGGGGNLTPVASVNEMFEDVVNDVDIVKEGWSNIAEVGTRKWRGKVFNTEKYAQATSYKTTDNSNTSWLITPPVIYGASKTINFKSSKAYWVHDGFGVYISTNYDGTNVAAATWTKINCTIAGSANADHEWVPSGSINASSLLPSGYSGNFFIAFKYEGDKVNTTTYRVDEIVIQ
ncbi:MAG: DUF5689 domain-containing protein [Bacteroidales bacterium]|nr:DUF5689 domain-containing protein [Bacteroidales bacterium]